MSPNYVMICTQYTKTRDTTHPDTYNKSDLADACTCGGLPYSTKVIVTMSHPSHSRLALNGFQASCYSHH